MYLWNVTFLCNGIICLKKLFLIIFTKVVEANIKIITIFKFIIDAKPLANPLQKQKQL